MQSAQKTTANDFPLYLFHQGKNFEAHKFFGAHPFRRGRGQFYRFRVWAPRVYLSSVHSTNGTAPVTRCTRSLTRYGRQSCPD